MPEIVMPRMSDTMEEGTVIRWLKQEGETISKGEPLAEIETDKATMPLESYEAGVIERILVPEGKTVPIGEPIVVIGRPGEGRAAAPTPTKEKREEKPAPTPEAPAAPRAEEREEREGAVPAPPPAEEIPEAMEVGVLRASPLARKIAAEQGVDLRQVRGTGPGGRVTRTDVEEHARTRRAAPAVPTTTSFAPEAPAAEAPPPVAAVDELRGTEMVKQSRIEQTIARRMIQSKAPIPHFYLSTEVDMAAAMRLRSELNAAWAPEKVGPNDLIIRAVALALRAHPQVNASYADGQVAVHHRINIGIAVAVGTGLIVPVLHDADKKDLRTIAAETKPLIERTREGRMQPGDLAGGTFSISNLGMYAVEDFFAIINPPEAGILAVGSIRPRPVVRDGQLAISETMMIGLSADHRVFSGATGAEFLGEVKRLLENPHALLR